MSLTFAKNRCYGFTLVELVAVLLILAILAGSIMLRWAPGDQSLPAQADLFARTLRHTQAMAAARGISLTLEVQSPDRYAITDGATIITLDNGVTLNGTDLRFDSLGRPWKGSGLLATTQSWVLTGNNSIATIHVQPLTGFVTVTP